MKLSCTTEGTVISEENSILLNERLKNIDLFRRSLVRKRQDRLSEVVAREGRLNAVAESVQCIFSFHLENEECLEKAASNCDICHAFCCDLHKPHEAHQELVVAHPHILLRQQIAATAASADSNSTVAREQPTSSAASKKQPKRNSKEDLYSRYMAVTGKMSVEAKYKKLLVGEFRVIVEELERANGILTGPATTNTNADQTVTSTANSLQSGPQIVPPVIHPTAPTLSSDLSNNPITQLNQLLLLIQSNPGVLDMLTTRIPLANNHIPPVDNNDDFEIDDEEDIL